MDKRKIILDCDPGHDDAVAIMMAAKHPKLELLGITVIAGNQTIEKTTRNALNICQKLKIDVPVCAGCARPLVKERSTFADEIHGETGLDGPIFHELTKAQDSRHGVNFIIETLMESQGDITLVPTGPLTNIAMAMRLEPRIIPKIKEIVLMGGSYQLGNVTPAAEFNIYVDAEAAHIVFSSGIPIVMLGLDVTRKVLCVPTVVDRMEKIKNAASELFVDLMRFFGKTQKEMFGFEGGPLHDPTCIAYLIDESCIEVKPMYTEIELRSEQSYGRTNCDYFGNSLKEPNAKVGIDINPERFWDIVEECIKLYN